MFSRWLACRFGLVTVSALYESSTRIVCTSPAASAGTSAVTVTLNGVDYSVTGGDFTHTAAARVASLSPQSGAVEGGTVVTVSGSGFVSSESLQCRFTVDGLVSRYLVELWSTGNPTARELFRHMMPPGLLAGHAPAVGCRAGQHGGT